MAARPARIALLAVLAAVACGTAAAGDSSPAMLPLLKALPRNCSSVLATRNDDTCDSLSAYGNLDPDTYGSLNPLALCGILPPAPLVCVGGKLSTCSNIYSTVDGDTCGSIEADVGTIIGPGDLNCSALVSGTDVCVRPAANLCDVDKLCGQTLTSGMRDMLGTTPDWCTVLRECKASLSVQKSDTPVTLTATLKDITPAVSQVAGNDGHPELREFVRVRQDGGAQLQIVFAPNLQPGVHATNFLITSKQPKGRRKLLATNSSTGQTQYYVPKRYR